MPKKLKIMMLASEGVPFIKTGGLADVIGALPAALQTLGHEVIVILPKYARVDAQKFNLQIIHSPMGVWMGDTEEWCAVYQAGSAVNIRTYFVESQKYFARDGIYHDADIHDYDDNPRRFAFFTRAALQFSIDIDFRPDIVHAHDWQTALACAYLKIWHWDDPVLGDAASYLTIHNIGYQGVYDSKDYGYTGLQQLNFVSDKFEDHGRMNYLKGGIYYADGLNTVSPKYALETRTPKMGHGLAPFLNNKGDHYIGILNGVDYSQWDPEIDALIPSKFSPGKMDVKRISKKALQERLGLDVESDVPLIGLVSRFAVQKGLDIFAQAIESIMQNMHVQFAILGSGNKELEEYFGQLPGRFKGRVGVHIGYDNILAHWIEAGLNQIYSLKYGALPIVRATGGLDDTVQQYAEATGTGTGFKFNKASPHAIYYTVGWAVSTYYDREEHYLQMQQQAMGQCFSWENSAKTYVDAYRRSIKRKRAHSNR
jgi:starch synthase